VLSENLAMVDEHQRLQNPPLLEAVFEVRADIAASLTVLPGKLAAALETDYPDVKETDFAKFVLMAPPPPEAGFVATHQFRTSDGKGMVQLAPAGFSVNSLAYPGFQAFRSAVAKVLASYGRHASVSAVRRLGLRYVNGLPLPGGELLSGLTASVKWPALEAARLTSVAARGIFAYSQPKGHLAVVIGAPQETRTTLDLDFYHEPRAAMAERDILSWIDEAHQRIYEAFRSMADPKVFESWRRGHE
jgi:uncharacterized protein (TIGR04255 family)